MRIVFFGYQQPGYACLNELIKIGEEIPLVVTHRDSPNEKIWFGSVRDLASSNGIPVLARKDISWAALEARIKKIRPDLLLSVYFRERVPERILALPAFGAVNLHGSILPKYRGCAPVNWMILRGEKTAGFTFHFMEKRLDSGDIILQCRIPIGPRDEALDLYRKMSLKLPGSLRRLIRMFESEKIVRVKQDDAKATYFGRRRPEDGKIDWLKPAKEIKDLARALARPWPGAFTSFHGKRLYIWKTRASRAPRKGGMPAGSIAHLSGKDGIGVACLSGIVWCKELQTEGEPNMTAVRFAKKYGVRRGEKFT